jgi:hypothetical protein
MLKPVGFGAKHATYRAIGLDATWRLITVSTLRFAGFTMRRQPGWVQPQAVRFAREA